MAGPEAGEYDDAGKLGFSAAVIGGVPSVAFGRRKEGTDRYELFFTIFDASTNTWKDPILLDNNGGSYGFTYISMVDGGGYPQIAYHDWDNGSLEFIEYTGNEFGAYEASNWNQTRIDYGLPTNYGGWKTVGASASLAIINGDTCVAYANSTDGEVLFQRRTLGAWEFKGELVGTSNLKWRYTGFRNISLRNIKDSAAIAFGYSESSDTTGTAKTRLKYAFSTMTSPLEWSEVDVDTDNSGKNITLFDFPSPNDVESIKNWWSFNELDGASQAVDNGKSLNHLSVGEAGSSPSRVEGFAGNALYVQSADYAHGSINLFPEEDGPPSKSISFSTWIKFTGADDVGYIFDLPDFFSLKARMMSNGAHFTVGYPRGAGPHSNTFQLSYMSSPGDLNVSVGDWAHIVFTCGEVPSMYSGFNGHYYNLYVNGERVKHQISSYAWNTTRCLGQRDIFIGARGWDLFPEMFNGEIDDLRIYNKELSATEVSELFAGDTQPLPAPSKVIPPPAPSSTPTPTPTPTPPADPHPNSLCVSSTYAPELAGEFSKTSETANGYPVWVGGDRTIYYNTNQQRWVAAQGVHYNYTASNINATLKVTNPSTSGPTMVEWGGDLDFNVVEGSCPTPTPTPVPTVTKGSDLLSRFEFINSPPERHAGTDSGFLSKNHLTISNDRESTLAAGNSAGWGALCNHIGLNGSNTSVEGLCDLFDSPPTGYTLSFWFNPSEVDAAGNLGRSLIFSWNGIELGHFGRGLKLTHPGGAWLPEDSNEWFNVSIAPNVQNLPAPYDSHNYETYAGNWQKLPNIVNGKATAWLEFGIDPATPAGEYGNLSAGGWGYLMYYISGQGWDKWVIKKLRSKPLPSETSFSTSSIFAVSESNPNRIDQFPFSDGADVGNAGESIDWTGIRKDQGGVTQLVVSPGYKPNQTALDVPVTLDWNEITQTLPEAGEWCFMTVSWDSERLKLYKDGVLIGSKSARSIKSGITSESNMLLGTNNSTNYPDPCIKGHLSDVRFYGKALSQSEIISVHGGDFSDEPEGDATTDNSSIVNTIECFFQQGHVIGTMNGTWYEAGKYNGKPYYKRLEVTSSQNTDKEFLSYAGGKWGFRTSVGQLPVTPEGSRSWPDSRSDFEAWSVGDDLPINAKWPLAGNSNFGSMYRNETRREKMVKEGGNRPNPEGSTNSIDQSESTDTGVRKPTIDDGGNSYFINLGGDLKKILKDGSEKTLGSIPDAGQGGTKTPSHISNCKKEVFLVTTDTGSSPSTTTLHKFDDSNEGQGDGTKLDLSTTGKNTEFAGLDLDKDKGVFKILVRNIDDDGVNVKTVTVDPYEIKDDAPFSNCKPEIFNGTNDTPSSQNIVIDSKGNSWFVIKDVSTATHFYKIIATDPLGNEIPPSIDLDPDRTFDSSKNQLTLDNNSNTLYIITQDSSPQDILSAYDTITKTLKWERPFGNSTSITGSPAVSTGGPNAGTIYLGTLEGNLIGIDPKTGENKFGPTSIGGACGGTPTTDPSGAVYTFTTDGDLSKFPGDLSNNEWVNKGYKYPGCTGFSNNGSKVSFGDGTDFVVIGSDDPTITEPFPTSKKKYNLTGCQFGPVTFGGSTPTGTGFKYTTTITGGSTPPSLDPVTLEVTEDSEGNLKFFEPESDGGGCIFTGVYNPVTGKLVLTATNPYGTDKGFTDINETLSAGKIREFKKRYYNLLKNGKLLTFRTFRDIRVLLSSGDSAELILGDGPSKISVKVLQSGGTLMVDPDGEVGGGFALERIGDEASFSYKDYKYKLTFTEEGSTVIDVEVFLSSLPPVYLTAKNVDGDYWEESISNIVSAKRDGSLFVHNGLFVTGYNEELYNLSEFVTGATKTLEDHTAELSTITTSPALIPPSLNTAEIYNIDPPSDGMIVFNFESGRFAGYSSANGGWNTFDWQ